jgi:hypothetical protein
MNTSIVKKILYVAIPLAALAIVVIKIKWNKQKAEQAVHRYDETAPVIVELETVSYSKLKAGRSYSGEFCTAARGEDRSRTARQDTLRIGE